MVPELNTPRLRLRGLGLADFPRFAALWADPAMIRHILSAPRSQGDSWRAFLANAGSWALCGHGQWAICRHDSGTMIGHTGFFFGKRGLGADFDSVPECGWVLAPEAWGQGYGREAVEAVHRWFDAAALGPASVAMIETGHAGSERIAAGLGYRPLRAAALPGPPVMLYRRDGAGAGGR